MTAAPRAFWEKSGMKLNQVMLVGLTMALLMGATCTVRIPDPNNPGGVAGYIPLDEATADVVIAEFQDEPQAEVEARFSGPLGLFLELTQGQAVAVNGTTLSGPTAGGRYLADVPVAAEYVIRTTEPTRGVQETIVASPGSFAIAAPQPGATVSLGGFVVSWSNPDPSLQVEITLTQTIFGGERTEEFGPFTDTGSQSFLAEDLADFRQGADLLILVTRTNERQNINGFRNGTVLIERTRTVTVHPGP